MQVGGSDQWGNMVAGVDLIRRKEQAVVHALTVPLVIDKTTGKKFGKSEGNAVWLDPVKTSPFAFYQFWLQVADENVEDYLKLYTLLPLDEISSLLEKWHDNKGARLAQKTLAYEITAIVHGKESAMSAVQVSKVLFGEVQLRDVQKADIDMLREFAPFKNISAGTGIVDLLVDIGLAQSKREARTFLANGAITIDGVVATDEEVLIQSQPQLQLIKRGKKHLVVVEVV
jgi:tyrosyl-tRNA synthetase